MKKLILISAMILCGASYGQESFTIDDALRMGNVDDVKILPDGTSVFYSISSLDWSKNERTKRYFLASSDGSSVSEYTSIAGGESFSFSPDGKSLAFLREVESDSDSDELKMQIFIMPTNGGEVIQVSEHPGKIVDYKWSPNVETIFFVAEDVYDEETEREIESGADPIFVDEAPNGKERARFSNIWKLDLIDGKNARKITNEKLIIDEFALGSDNATIIFVARPDDRTNYGHFSELYIYKGGKLEQLTFNEAPESLPLISPDASKFAYRAPSDEGFDLRSGYFWVMDLETRKKNRLDGQKTGEVLGAVTWSADSTSLIYNEQHGVNTNLYEINTVNGVAKALTKKTGIHRAQAFSADTKTVAYIFEDHMSPKDVYVSNLSLSEPIRLTDANPWIREDRTLTQGEVLQWEGKGGMLIEGIYYPPVRKGRSSGKDPLIVFIHGGPAAAWEANFRDDFQIMTNAGYAILAPNPRGSQGYGEDFLQALRGEVGDGEFIDMM
ncbi:MAG: prolyl oligopeptidase family serine peptidase, partial [Planctomycetaceae bacterium]|nr:prolyl oligopeptidase family serine peptidase [Planctomycetaceae bacterium]